MTQSTVVLQYKYKEPGHITSLTGSNNTCTPQQSLIIVTTWNNHFHLNKQSFDIFFYSESSSHHKVLASWTTLNFTLAAPADEVTRDTVRDLSIWSHLLHAHLTLGLGNQSVTILLGEIVPPTGLPPLGVIIVVVDVNIVN